MKFTQFQRASSPASPLSPSDNLPSDDPLVQGLSRHRRDADQSYSTDIVVEMQSNTVEDLEKGVEQVVARLGL